MPIYRISRRGLEEHQALVAFRRLRLAALVLSAALLTIATMLLLHATR